MIRLSIAALLGATLPAIPFPALAGDTYGFHFTHKDWELACDNTRTCRAAGYQEDDGRLPAVSVLLERQAGAGQPVIAKVRIGDYAEDAPRPQSSTLAMSIDRKPQGDVQLDPQTSTARLGTAQMEALVRALAKDSVVQWTDGHQAWTVSGKGAAAVLLKMDEYQRRIGTHTALIRRGNRGEEKVAAAVPVPEISPASAGSTEVDLPPAARAALLREVRGTIGKEDCSGFAADRLAALRLTPEKLLVQVPCWTGAYNEGTAFWIANRTAPYSPVLVTLDGSDYAAGVVSATQKGRGLGDCWRTQEWVWDGRRFMLAEDATTGMCRMVAAGGAWKLYTYTAKVTRGSR
ncbi:DUF1176 domain-containing protein [Pseudoduganella lurida]|nr:DUF1176 domain-containing protein [Pseudoduganella lurida]